MVLIITDVRDLVSEYRVIRYECARSFDLYCVMVVQTLHAPNYRKYHEVYLALCC